MEIIRGTTPTLQYTFKDIEVTDISEAYLVLKQPGDISIEKTLSDGVIVPAEENAQGYLSFTLTQEDTLSLSKDREAVAVLDWKLQDGTRGRSVKAYFKIGEPGKDEVI